MTTRRSFRPGPRTQGSGLLPLSNSDIWFDDTLAKLQNATAALQGRRAYVLQRYGDNDARCVPQEEGHADTCIFAPPVAPEVDGSTLITNWT